MRRATVIVILVVVLAASLLLLVARPQLLDSLGIGRGPSGLRKMTTSFLEDIQFKDFKKAASYHTPEEQKTVDIPYLLERLFLIKPEQLDIMEYEILFAKVDTTGLRGRTKSRVKFKNLMDGKMHDRELVLYFERASTDAPWHMKLESSLRQIEGDEGKRH